MTEDPCFYIDLSTSFNSLSRPPLYAKLAWPIIGLAEGPLEPPRRASECFNCGSPDHALRNCPKPRDRVAIQRARDEYQDGKPDSSSPTKTIERFYEAEQRAERQERFLRDFLPGRIGPDLREAVDFAEGSIDYPWLYRFLEWGFPPGYEKWQDEETPFEAMARRIKGSSSALDWRQAGLLQMDEGSGVSVDPAPPTSLPPDRPLPPPLPATRLRVRYASYPTTLFDDRKLPVCFPDPLPTLERQERELSSDMDMSN
jgi:hypothetical protein